MVVLLLEVVDRLAIRPGPVEMTLRFNAESSCWNSEPPWMPLGMVATHAVQMVLVLSKMLNHALSKTK